MATDVTGTAGNRLLTKTGNRRFGSIFVAVAAFAATVLPLFLFLKRFPRIAPLAVNAVDSFYYLTVARNSLRTSFYSFDGMYPTNGFHPVWQFLLYTAMRWNVLKPSDPFITLHRLYIGNVLLLGFGFGLLAAFCAQRLNRQWLAFAAICPGFLWFAVALSAPSYLSNWSYLNGMETSVELVCLGLALLSFSTDSRSSVRLPISMFCFGLMVLCRLDDVFFLLPVIALVWISRSRRPMYQTLISVVIPGAMIAAYLMYNRMTVGILMPTSGTVKAGLSVWSNWRLIEQIVFPIRWFIYGGMNWFPEIFMRVYQMICPVFLCGAYVLQRHRDRLGLIEALCLGVVLKGLYNFTNVQLFHQGSWYYAASIFAANLVIALWLDRAAFLLRPMSAKRVSLSGCLGVAAVIVMGQRLFQHLRKSPNCHRRCSGRRKHTRAQRYSACDGAAYGIRSIY